MKRKIVRTADGSATLQIPEWQEHYHSTHGAIQESRHVFLQMGLEACSGEALKILEMGFGTGLNALLTCLAARERRRDISYTALEAFPLGEGEWGPLNYPSLLEDPGAFAIFEALHRCPWEAFREIRSGFRLLKRQLDFLDFRPAEAYDLIYYDAFGARVQPELWTPTVFDTMFEALAPGGLLVTYAAKGSVRRAMISVGFEVERLPGPPGKREMLRARRPHPLEC